MIGRLLYLYKRKFGEGYLTAYYRDTVAPRIQNSSPVRIDPEGECELHVLTCHGDLNACLWNLKSFYLVVGSGIPLVIHDDGSLTVDDRQTLLHLFPNARVILREEADRALFKVLKPFPLCIKVRETNNYSLKLFDFPHFARTSRFMIMDSDILTFSLPEHLMSVANSSDFKYSTLNRDWRYGYSLDMDHIHDSGFAKTPERINTGLGVVQRASYDFARFERILGLPGLLDHPYPGRIEQTTLAISLSEDGFEFLPEEYDVRMGPTPNHVPMRHYVTGGARHLMYREGYRLLNKTVLK
jgi:hypothetical protein